MAVDMLIEDDDNYYYVNENGAMVTNQWVAIENEDAGEEDEPDNYWYYFQANGKAYKRSDSVSSDAINAKVINGKKYAFDTDGKMLYGWVKDGERQTDDDAWKDAEYYFGDENDGAMSIGWRLISITDDDAESAEPGDEFWDEDQDRWFWFKSSGKKQTDKDGKTINGKKYGFDEYGRMIASWNAADVTKTTEVSTTALATKSQIQGIASYSEGFMYFSDPESGARYTKDWFKVVPGYYLHESKYNDGDEYWYYADGNGNLYANVIKTIKGKKYAFDNYGRMITGLVFLEMAEKDTSSEIAMKYADDAGDYKNYADGAKTGNTGAYDTEDNFDEFVVDHQSEIAEGWIRCYYFGGSEDGAMKTGKQNVVIDGDTFTFKFKTGSNLKGAGINGFDDDKLYTAGKQVKADKDDKYKVYKVTTGADNYCLVEGMTVTEFLKETKATSEYDSKKEETVWTIPSAAYTNNVKYYLLNSSGTVIKSKTGAKDSDDYKFTVKNKVITEVILED